jgi:hypothetical protein
VGGERGE